jgi:hypothetical protein
MTRRGPRSVPVLLFVFLAFLDLTVLFPWAWLVLEPAAALALLGAVIAAAAHVTGTYPRPRPGDVAPDELPVDGEAAAPVAMVPMPRRPEVVTRSPR